MVIGGKAVDARSGATFETENPYTGRPWAVVPDGGPDDVDAAVGAARAALDGEWDEYLAGKAVWVELSGGTRDPFTLG